MSPGVVRNMVWYNGRDPRQISMLEMASSKSSFIPLFRKRMKNEQRLENFCCLHIPKQRLLSVFIVYMYIVNSWCYFLNPNFQTCSHLMWLYTGFCGAWSKTQKAVFLRTQLKYGMFLRLDSKS